MPEFDPADVGDREIVEPVVVEIAHGAAHSKAGAVQSDPFGYVVKRPVSPVAVKSVRPRLPGNARILQRAILNADEVEEAVGVVIDPANSASDRLGDGVRFGCRIEVAKGYSGGFGPIDEQAPLLIFGRSRIGR